jgi:hypothetical protein
MSTRLSAPLITLALLTSACSALTRPDDIEIAQEPSTRPAEAEAAEVAARTGPQAGANAAIANPSAANGRGPIPSGRNANSPGAAPAGGSCGK